MCRNLFAREVVVTHDSSFLLQQSIASLFPKKQIKKEHGVTELCGSIDAIGLYSKS